MLYRLFKGMAYQAVIEQEMRKISAGLDKILVNAFRQEFTGGLVILDDE